ncbi:MAG: uS10/mL48 family ribosomal protein [Candidatus Hodgkinia cicadicola]
MRIRLKSYNVFLLTKYVNTIALVFSFTPNVFAKQNASLPTRITKYTVNKSPHIDKKSRDQFEIRTYTKVIDVRGRFNLILSKLFAVEQPSGVLMELMPLLSAEDGHLVTHARFN